MAGSILLSGIQLDAVIGVYPHERNVSQPLLVDLEVKTDFERAAETDNIEDALNYEALLTAVKHHIISGQYKLLECLADALADHLLKTFPLYSVRLRVGKPKALPGVEMTAVEITRGYNADSP